MCGTCDALKPGCLVDHRQPAENPCVSYHETHTCVTRPNKAHTSIQQKMHNLYKKKSLFTILFNYNLHKNGSSFQNLQNTKIRSAWPFLRLYGLKCVPSPGAPPVPEINIFPRQGEQCLVVEFSYLGYSPPKCSCNDTPNIQFTFHIVHVNILSMHILTKLTHVIHSYQ